MDNSKQEIVEKLQSANNILVTVSSNPSVDQLAACIGLTLVLNKLDKHATAVYSGKTPSTIEFLKPAETIEKNTDSLRDFIIALDKSKADKLRYKVEDKVVKIFITPYKTSLSSDDLNFSQGDFNIDIVLALGVHEQTDLDEAITSHGRILHDATVACINNTPSGELGSVNWQKPEASSLSELIVELTQALGDSLFDPQVATALLTGIVAETDRFRNEKTTAATMSLSSILMGSGADQQLVAKELEHEVDVRGDNRPQQAKSGSDQNDDKPKNDAKPDDGTLEIKHQDAPKESAPPAEESTTQPTDKQETDQLPAVGPAKTEPSEPAPVLDLPRPEEPEFSRSLITEAPTLGGRLTANTIPEDEQMDAAIDPLKGSPTTPLLSHDDDEGAHSKAPDIRPPADEQPGPAPQPTPKPSVTPPVSAPQPQPTPAPATPAPASPTPPAPVIPTPTQTPPSQPLAPTTPQTLTELEESVESPHSDTHVDSLNDVDEVEKARQEVLRAISEQPNDKMPPVQSLNAQPLADLRADHSPAAGAAPQPSSPQVPAPLPPLPPNVPEAAPFSTSPADQPLTMPMPSGVNLPPPQVTPPTNAPGAVSTAPPPVPPPMVPTNFPK